MRKLRKIGIKVVGLYALTSAISVVIGLCMAYLINPDKGFDISLLSGTSKYSVQNMLSVIALVTMFPENVFNSVVTTNLLQVIVFAVFLGTALIMMGAKGLRISGAINDFAEAIYKITGIVMGFSPSGF